MDSLRSFLRLYYQPMAAMNDLLDRGRLAVAAISALAVAFAAGLMGAAVAIALVMAPVAILILAAWQGMGGAGVVFRRDYAPVLVCVLTGWAASHLPLAAARLIPGLSIPAAVRVALLVFFGVLATCAFRTVMGASYPRAAIAVVAGWVVAAAAGRFLGGSVYYLASPYLLFLGYRLLQSDMSQVARGLGSRQSLKRQLEAAAVNPRDADAQYQLGLIYRQRRNYEAALSHFGKAIEIDPAEPGPHFEMGRIAREQGRMDAAAAHLEKALRLDDKFSSSEVLRDFGSVSLELSRMDDALTALEKYRDRRPYDPEGLYYHGLALKRAGRGAEARDSFQAAIEAVQTAPRHMRRAVSSWKGQAEREIRGLS